MDRDPSVSERAASVEQVRLKLRNGWRNDPAVLEQYFHASYNNWKVYKGDRTPKQVLKLQAIYKQAVYGDNSDPCPLITDVVEFEKWKAWESLKGTPQEMAKRRFITFLSSIDPLLIDVMPDEKPPPGFPLDRRGNPICAKCNTTVGCIRPLLDNKKMNLKQHLYENEDLHEPEKLRGWIRHALQHQRCVWGVHQAISKAEAKPFMDWFERTENRGFFAYDSVPIVIMVKELVDHYHQIAYDIMQKRASNPNDIDPDEYNIQAVRAIKVKEVFEVFAGEEYKFELPCERDYYECNQRRETEGGKNHKHEVVLDPPTYSDTNSLEEAMTLRQQCQKLGINPSTGVVKNVAERCEIYRRRIADHFEALRKAAEAKIRNEERLKSHKGEKKKVVSLSKEMTSRQVGDACQLNLVDHLLGMVKRGANPNEESARGITPMLCLIMNEAPIEKLEELLHYKADINRPNRHGMTPLMLACRLQDMKMVHLLMRSGASALQKGKNGQNALHVCATHGNEEAARTIVSYLKDGVGDSMRVTRFIDAMDIDGETPLIGAARKKSGIMCHLILSLGANPTLRNSTGRTAAYVARSKGWNEIADWLDKKVGGGVAKVETYSDMQFEKQSRFALLKMRDLLQTFGKNYLLLVQRRLGVHPLGCPFKAQQAVEERGKTAIAEQKQFMESHFRYILNSSSSRIDQNDDFESKDDSQSDMKRLSDMTQALKDMADLVRQGYGNPNTEIAAQPLPWTPVMCAVALNDVRTLRLLVRDGGNINHPNKDGTTAVMLAAQLQHTELLADIIITNGADLKLVDNQGFTPLAYATSLPLPSSMERTMIDVLVDDDATGPKQFNTSELIKLAIASGKNGLKEAVIKNKEIASAENVEAIAKFTRLLEHYGLTPLRNEHNIFYQLKTSEWRVQGDLSRYQSTRNDSDLEQDDEMEEEDSINPYAEEAKQRGEEENARKRREKEERLKFLDPNELRCPVCTLSIPCAHFFKAEALIQFIKKNDSITITGKSKTPVLTQASRKIKMKNKAQQVLEETQLADRGTDRSAALAKKYQVPELLLEKEKLAQKMLDSERLSGLEDNEDDKEEEEEEEEIEELYDYDWSASAVSRSPVEVADSSSALIPEPDAAKRSASNALVLKESMTKTVALSDASRVKGIAEGEVAVIGSGSLEGPVTATEGEEVAVRSILKPASREASREGGVSRKSRRVKFNLPDLVEESAVNEWGDDADSAFNSLGGIQSPDAKVVIHEGAFDFSADEVKAAEEVASATDSLPADIGGALNLLQKGSAAGDSAVKKREMLEKGPRRVIMFTRDKIGHKDGPFAISKGERDEDLSESPHLSTEAAPRSDEQRLQTSAERIPSPAKSMQPTPRAGTPAARVGTPGITERPRSNGSGKSRVLKIELSGWLFVHLSDLKNKSAMPAGISLAQEAWVLILDQLAQTWQDEWMTTLDLDLQVDLRTWRTAAPRCILCSVGYVRNRQSLGLFRSNEADYIAKEATLIEEMEKDAPVSDSIDCMLCLQCLIRKDLFSKVIQSQPRSVRKSLNMRWPLLTFETEKDRPSTGSMQFEPLGSPAAVSTQTPSPSLINSKSTLSRFTFEGLTPNSSFQFSTTSDLSGSRATSRGIFSPIASFKLQSLDYMEQKMDELRINTPINFDDDSQSLQSMSLLSMTESTLTSAFPSTISMVDPVKHPREMLLLPYLVATGHFEDAERTVRIILSKRAIDEGEGMAQLLRLLSTQADMYKAMGLWVLAFSIYLDLTEMCLTLLGLGDRVTIKALSLLHSCLCKMHEPELADRYMQRCVDTLANQLRKQARADLVERIQQLRRDNNRVFLQLNGVWAILIKLHLEEVRSELRQRYCNSLGVGGLYLLMTGGSAAMTVARRSFFEYCKALPTRGNQRNKELKVLAEFTDLCFRMRQCDDEEVYRYYIQHILQKYLAKSLVSTSSLARKFREVTPRDEIRKIIDFLHNGVALDVQVFDEIIFFSLFQLSSVYRHYLIHSNMGEVLRATAVEVIAEAIDVAATYIQCWMRRHHAKIIMNKRRSDPKRMSTKRPTLKKKA